MWYWYEQVVIGLIVYAVMYLIKQYVFNGSDIILSIVDIFKREKK